MSKLVSCSRPMVLTILRLIDSNSFEENKVRILVAMLRMCTCNQDFKKHLDSEQHSDSIVSLIRTLICATMKSQIYQPLNRIKEDCCRLHDVPIDSFQYPEFKNQDVLGSVYLKHITNNKQEVTTMTIQDADDCLVDTTFKVTTIPSSDTSLMNSRNTKTFVGSIRKSLKAFFKVRLNNMIFWQTCYENECSESSFMLKYDIKRVDKDFNDFPKEMAIQYRTASQLQDRSFKQYQISTYLFNGILMRQSNHNN